MKTHARKCLAWLLALALSFSLLPVSVLAAEEGGTGTFTKISTLDDLTTGKYVMIVSTGYAPTVLNGTWVDAVELSAADDTLLNPEANVVWTLDVSGTDVSLTDSAEVSIAPKGGNNNGIQSGDYQWTIAVTENETFTFSGKDADTVILASNKQSENKFRAYKTATASGSSGYATEFTLYKLSAGSVVPEPEQVATPKASPAAGQVPAGTQVTLTCATGDAVIYYTTDGSVPSKDDGTEYTAPIEITEAMTIKAIAVDPAGELTDSEVLEAEYTILSKSTIAAARAAEKGTELMVQGVVIAKYVNATMYSLGCYIQDETGGIMLYDSKNLKDYEVGDLLTVVGTAAEYNGKFELTKLTSVTSTDTATVEPKAFDMSKLGDSAEVEANEGVLVSLSCLTVSGVTTDNYGTCSLALQSGDDTLTAKLDNRRPGFEAGSLEAKAIAGSVVTITGYFESTNSNNTEHVFHLRDIEDVTVTEEPSKVLTPTASPDGGNIAPGGVIAFSCETPEAAISYSLDAGETWTEGNSYTVPADAEIGSAIAIQVKAVKDGQVDSEVAEFTYTVADSPIGKWAKVADSLNEGDQFVIYYNAGSLVMSDTPSGSRLSGVSAEPQGRYLQTAQGMSILTAAKDADGHYTFTNLDGKYLTSGETGNSLSFADAAGDYSLWDIVPADGGVHVVSTNAKYKGVAQALEYYGGFTTYNEKNDVAYLFNLYVLTNEDPVFPAEAPVISPAESASSEKTVSVTITSATEGAEIRYTTNGDGPTAASDLYEGPFQIDLSQGAVTVKAIALKAGMEASDVSSKTYMYNDPNAEFVPVLSIDEVKTEGYFVVIPKEYPTKAMSTSFAQKPTGVDVTLENGTYAPTLKFAPMDDGISIQYEATGKYLGYSSSTNFAESAVPYKFNVTVNSDGTFRLIPSSDSGRAISYRGSDGTGVFAPYSAKNDGTTDDYGTYECDMLIYRSVNGYLYNPQVSFGVLNDAVPGQDYVVTYSFTETDQVSDVAARYSVDGENWTDAALDAAAQTVTVPGASIPQGTTRLYLKITATDTRGDRITAMEKTAEVKVTDDPVISAVSPANGAETGEGNLKPTITVTVLNSDEFTAKITLRPKTGEAITDADMTVDGGAATYTPAADLAEGWCEVSVTVTRQDGKTATREWAFTVGVARYSNYFGQLHSHTAEYSDGAGTLAEALEYIKNTAYRNNVQFAAFTDHSNYFDGATGPKNADGTAGGAIKEDGLYDTSLLTEAQLAHWMGYKEAVAQFNTENDGDMVAIAGFEMTWSGGPGHINTFNTPGIVSRNNNTLNSKNNDAGMRAYYTLLSNDKGEDSISQFNHPGTTFGTFAEFAYYDPVIDSRITLVEVGNGEGAIGSGGYFPSYSEYIKALDKGWHLAPTNNQDNHKGHWGDSNDARTVIYTSDLSEQGIYQAMRDMRLYATEDKNLDIVYTVNGQMLGSIVDDIPDSARFQATVSDPDGEDIATVEIVTNGGAVVHKAEVNAPGYTLDWTKEAPAPGYYFLRVTQADKDIAVTAPVWLGKAKNVGMSELTTDTFMVVQNESITVKNQFFNNESTAATVKKLTYALQDGTVLSETTPDERIAAMGTLDKSFTHAFTAVGRQTLTLTAVVEVAGEEKILRSSLELDVKDPEKLIYIGIDGSHHNEYVSGNYKDSMGNFGTLAADYDVRVNVLYSSEDLLDALENPKYQMMVFTTPTRRLALTDTWTSYDVYSEAELAAVARFAQRGGTVVVTGWGDYYESYSSCPKEPEMQMSAQQNALLSAIGSSLRVADDEAKDNDNKPGNNAPRLYLIDYNGMQNPLLAGVDPSQVWSQYGGSTIYAVDEDGQPTETLPDSVIPMVSGYGKYESDGTGIDLDKINSYDEDKDGYMNGYPDKTVRPPKYQSDNGLTCLLTATETVTHADGATSLVVVSGGAFMSNFEIKFDLDNATQLGYSNPVVLGNLVESLNPATITDIATVQASGQEGDEFTVEGYITANTSGYDRDTAFFDCTYVQDETAGINIFPVSDSFQIGQKVQVSGTITYYQGEKELTVKSIKLLDGTPAEIAPIKVTTEEAAGGAYLGSLIQVQGTVTSVENANGAIQTIRLKDDSGVEARIFIDGYITASKDAALQEFVKVGAVINAVGIASYDNTFNADGSESNRIRIRDRADITLITSAPAEVTVTVTWKNWDGEILEGPVSFKKGEDEPEYTGATPTKEEDEENTYSFAGWERTEDENGNVTYTATFTATGKPVIDVPDDPGFEPAPTVPSTPDEPVIKPSDVVETDSGVEVTIPDNGAQFSDAAQERLVSLNEEKPVTMTGEGLKVVIPAGTLSSGVNPADLLVDTTKGGNAVQVTYPDGTTEIVPFALVADSSVAYVAAKAGTYALVDNTKTFTDVSDQFWAADAVDFVSANELFNGTGDGCFSPTGTMTRAMVVTVLARLGAAEVDNGTVSFPDVPTGEWYSGAVAWASQNGIVTGSDGRFDPEGCLTREALCTILDRFLKQTGFTLDEVAGSDGFNDMDTVSDWARDSVIMALKTGLLTGKPGQMIDPTGDITRAEVATVLQRLIKAVLS